MTQEQTKFEATKLYQALVTWNIIDVDLLLPPDLSVVNARRKYLRSYIAVSNAIVNETVFKPSTKCDNDRPWDQQELVDPRGATNKDAAQFKLIAFKFGIPPVLPKQRESERASRRMDFCMAILSKSNDPPSWYSPCVWPQYLALLHMRVCSAEASLETASVALAVATAGKFAIDRELRRSNANSAAVFNGMHDTLHAYVEWIKYLLGDSEGDDDTCKQDSNNGSLLTPYGDTTADYVAGLEALSSLCRNTAAACTVIATTPNGISLTHGVTTNDYLLALEKMTTSTEKNENGDAIANITETTSNQKKEESTSTPPPSPNSQVMTSIEMFVDKDAKNGNVFFSDRIRQDLEDTGKEFFDRNVGVDGTKRKQWAWVIPQEIGDDIAARSVKLSKEVMRKTESIEEEQPSSSAAAASHLSVVKSDRMGTIADLYLGLHGIRSQEADIVESIAEKKAETGESSDELELLKRFCHVPRKAELNSFSRGPLSTRAYAPESATQGMILPKEFFECISNAMKSRIFLST